MENAINLFIGVLYVARNRDVRMFGGSVMAILVIIDREAEEIIRLVASVCLCVCLCVHLSVHLTEHSKWLGIQNGCCFDRLRHRGPSRF